FYVDSAPEICLLSRSMKKLVNFSKDNLENSVKNFFQIKSLLGDSTCDPDESKTFGKQYCEEHFLSTHKRDHGIVKLPVIEGKFSTLGDSKEIAERRLNLLGTRGEGADIVHSQSEDEEESVDGTSSW
ncbi:hypothetical protein AVEN_179840-1, partial [Araneus ventricosus]